MRGLLWVALAGIAGLAMAAESREFVIEQRASLDLSNISGDIAVRPGPAGKVTIAYQKDDDAVEVAFRQNGDAVTVETVYPTSGGSFGDVRFEISFPSEGEVSVRTVSGDIVVRGLSGELSLRSVSGDIETERLSGRLDLQSVSGDVRMQGLGAARVEAVSISGTAAYAGGALEGGPYRLSSTSGDIVIRHAKAASYRISGRTISGSILKTEDVGIEVVEDKYSSVKTVKGAYGGGDVRLEVNSVSGSIRIEVE